MYFLLGGRIANDYYYRKTSPMVNIGKYVIVQNNLNVQIYRYFILFFTFVPLEIILDFTMAVFNESELGAEWGGAGGCCCDQN